MAVASNGAVTFQTADYSREIEFKPKKYGRLGEMGLFAAEGVSTRTVIIDKVDGVIGVLGTQDPKGPGKSLIAESESSLPVIVPYLKTIDAIYPSDVIGRRAPGDTGPDTLDRVRARKLQKHRDTHEQTFEYMRIQAMQGITKDGKGKTIFDAFTQFGFSKQTETIGSSDKADAKARAIARKIEDNFGGMGGYDHIHVMCSPGAFDKLLANTSFAAIYTAQTGLPQNPLLNDARRGFVYQGIVFEEYNTTFKLEDNSTAVGIVANKAWAFPVGADIFRTYQGPAEKMDYVGTAGQEFYAFSYADDKQNKEELEAHSAPLMLCVNPKALVEITFS